MQQSIYYEIVKIFTEHQNTEDTDHIIKKYLHMYEDPAKVLKAYQLYASWTVKNELLRNSIRYFKARRGNMHTLLDLASGRGNDLNRWITLKIPQILGIEVDKEQYDTAVERIKESNGTKVKYVHGSALDKDFVKESLKRIYKVNSANIISCNFAMNYFFKNEQTIKDFFETVVSCMAPGSLFVGTAADGDVIKELLRVCGTIDTNLYFLKKSNNYDNGYEISLKTPYFTTEEKEEKAFTEFFIHKKELIEICKKYRLTPAKIDKYAAVCNFTSIRDAKYDKYGPTIRAMFFRFAFEKY